MSEVKNILDETKELDGELRDYLRANGEKTFDYLAGEEGKR